MDNTVYHAGTLRYSKKDLGRVFFWLLFCDFAYMLADHIHPRLLPIILKSQGASDAQITILVSSIPAAVQCVVMPFVGYWSDRTRSKWGRRLPYILCTAPLASALLAMTAFVPEIAQGLTIKWGIHLPFGNASFGLYALVVVAYRTVHTVSSSMFFWLIRDIVPVSHTGRFLALFRVVGATSLFAINYWLIGLALSESKAIFVRIAGLHLFGFVSLCIFLREGTYPVEPTRSPKGKRFLFSDAIRSCREFVAECFTVPIYLWTYATRLVVYASIPISSFLVFFAFSELHIPLERAGRLIAMGSVAWLIFAYPIGKVIDRRGSISVLRIGLGGSAIAFIFSFLFVVGEKTFLISSLVTGVMFWAVMVTQTALSQEIFSSSRFGQLSAANVIIQSIVIIFVISPGFAYTLEAIRSATADTHWTLPFWGTFILGPYRFVNLALAVLFGAGWFSLGRVNRHRSLLLDSDGKYRAPV